MEAERNADALDRADDLDVAAIVARAGELLEGTRPDGGERSAAELRSVLADGYACLLAIEADRSSLASRSTDLFASAGAVRTGAKELGALNSLLLERDRDIIRLRALLAELRERADDSATLAT
jgi:hypothetical protein